MEHLDKFQGIWNGDIKTSQNILFEATFWGFFRSLEENGSHITNLEHYLLKILPPQQAI